MQLYLHDVQRMWKPELKDIDPGGDSDTNYSSGIISDDQGARYRLE
jgi:hypothetical protein